MNLKEQMNQIYSNAPLEKIPWNIQLAPAIVTPLLIPACDSVHDNTSSAGRERTIVPPGSRKQPRRTSSQRDRPQAIKTNWRGFPG